MLKGRGVEGYAVHDILFREIAEKNLNEERAEYKEPKYLY